MHIVTCFKNSFLSLLGGQFPIPSAATTHVQELREDQSPIQAIQAILAEAASTTSNDKDLLIRSVEVATKEQEKWRRCFAQDARRRRAASFATSAT